MPAPPRQRRRGANDGTLLASDPPKPLPPEGLAAALFEGGTGSASGAGIGIPPPNRPLPPTPDEEAAMAAAGGASRDTLLRRVRAIFKFPIVNIFTTQIVLSFT
jgi:hypothetical protein